MPKCFWPGCNSSHPSDVSRKNGKQNKSKFTVPKKPFMLELWKKAIPCADITLSPEDRICELHFKKEDIETHYEHKLFDGNIFRLKRSRARLKPNAVPCFFSNLPVPSSSAKNKITKPNKKCVKHKKTSHPSNMQKEFKKAKISYPDNKTSKNNDSSLKTEKENVLMEAIVVHSLPEKSSTKQPSHLKERQNAENVTSSPISNSQSETPASPSLSSAPDIIRKNHSNQSICDKILTESPTPDKLTTDHFPQNNSITNITETQVPDMLTEKYSEQNSSIRTIIKSSTPDAVTEKSSKQESSIRNLTESSMSDTLIEKYSKQNSTISTITDSLVPAPLPDNYSDQTDYDKTLNEFSSIKLTGKDSDQDSDEVVTECNDISSDSDSEEQVSFDFLKANVNVFFETTNSWWRFSTFDDFIVFSRWTPDYTVERRIVITKDLTVKVYLMDKETAIGCDVKEPSLLRISRLIYRVENLTICSGIDKKDSNCVGYLQKAAICKKYDLCLNCIKWRREERVRVLKLMKESANCIELLNFNLIV